MTIQCRSLDHSMKNARNVRVSSVGQYWNCDGFDYLHTLVTVPTVIVVFFSLHNSQNASSHLLLYVHHHQHHPPISVPGHICHVCSTLIVIDRNWRCWPQFDRHLCSFVLRFGLLSSATSAGPSIHPSAHLFIHIMDDEEAVEEANKPASQPLSIPPIDWYLMDICPSRSHTP